ncbi:MAG TPA: hypothetical protein VD968_02510, partial [Pyrinomonadaceae bacterium]|nr:hypothetical protein [Pyrinomonadaceae bacterium]
DRNKKFRTKDDKGGITPPMLDRGFEEIDYLSYVSVPVVSNVGYREEMALGLINVDTKLFAADADDLEGAEETLEGDRTILTLKIKPDELETLAEKLYMHDDEAVNYLEDMRCIVIPLLELYAKCRQGAP